METAPLFWAGRRHLGMLSADKQVLLSGFLGQLPEQVAARLAKAVEVDRLIGGRLPHEEILRALRPQLRQSPQPQRTETPQRLFCRPFEDLLIEGERKTKQKGRIARASIDAVWNWLAGELMPERHAALVETIREAIVNGRDDAIEAKVTELWSEAARVLGTALSDEKGKSLATKKLGGMLVAEDAAEIALLVSGAQEMIALQKRLPKPVPNLSDDEIAFLRDRFDRLSAANPDLAPYTALVAMGRLERPWEALRLIAVLSRKSTDTLISNTDLGAVGELLFSDLDVHAGKIQSVRPTEFDSESLLAHLAAFTELSSGMVKELGIRRDGKWGQRLAKDRAAIAQTMEGLLQKAPKEILAALPQPKPGGGFGKTGKPLDVSRLPDPVRVQRAMRYASLLAYCHPFAVAASFSAKLNEVQDETTVALRSYSEEILREVRAADPAMQTSVEAHFTVMLDLSKLVLGDEEADFLRRRARVAASA